MSHGPIDKDWQELMNFLAGVLDKSFNGDAKGKDRTMGFALLLFPFGEDPKNRINYISNAERLDMLVALKEFIARNEGRVVDPGTVQ